MNAGLGLGINMTIKNYSNKNANMKIEKSSYTEIYNVETEKYDIAIQYHENLNIGYSEWEILSVLDKSGLEVQLAKDDKNRLKDSIVWKIMEAGKE